MSRRSGPTLADRTALTRARSAGVRAEHSNPGDAVSVQGKHCWVYAAPISTGGRTAALLVEWRRIANEWEGRVVYSVQLVDQVAVVDTWIPSSLLEPCT